MEIRTGLERGLAGDEADESSETTARMGLDARSYDRFDVFFILVTWPRLLPCRRNTSPTDDMPDAVEHADVHASAILWSGFDAVHVGAHRCQDLLQFVDARWR